MRTRVHLLSPRSVRSSMGVACVAILAAAFVALGFGCKERGPEVIAYVSVDEHAARPVLARFTERTGIRVKPLFDGEINKTTGLAARLRNERANPRADVFWSSESTQAGRLAREGVLAGGVEALEPTMVRGRVIVFDPARVAPETVPSTWWDLAEPTTPIRIAMADPRFGSTTGHLAAMHAWCNARGEPERFVQWARSLDRMGVLMLTSGNAGVVRAVASGEADMGMTDTDDVEAHRAQPGARVLDMRLLRHGPESGEGPWLVTGVAGIVAGAPNEAHARSLVAFLASNEAQQILSAAAPGFFSLADAARAGLVDGLRVDAELVEASMPEAIRIMMHAESRQ